MYAGRFGAEQRHVLTNIHLGTAAILRFMSKWPPRIAFQCLLDTCPKALELKPATILLSATNAHPSQFPSAASLTLGPTLGAPNSFNKKPSSRSKLEGPTNGFLGIGQGWGPTVWPNWTFKLQWAFLDFGMTWYQPMWARYILKGTPAYYTYLANFNV